MTKRAKPKPKRKPSPPDVTGGRKRDTRFQPGVSGNPDAQFKAGVSGNPQGRPPGARSKLSEAFFDDLGAVWAKYGPDCLEWLAQNDRGLFVQVVASLIPRNAKLDVDLGTKPIYLIRDHPLTEDEWAAKYCEPPKVQ